MWMRKATVVWRRTVTRAVREAPPPTLGPAIYTSPGVVVAGPRLCRVPADCTLRSPSHSLAVTRAYAARMRRRIAPQKPPEYEEDEEEDVEDSEPEGEGESEPRTLRLVLNDDDGQDGGDDDESEFSEEWEGIVLDFGGDGKDDDGKDAGAKPRIGAKMARRSLKR